MGPRLGSRGRRPTCVSSLTPEIRFNGATARKPWKTSYSGAITVTDFPASMGPRLGSRGRLHLGERGRGRNLDRFNGATARKPWKTVSSLALERRQRSFNGATARKPWKTKGSNQAKFDCLRASMGPRLGSRGRPCSPRSLAPPARSFNGATARKPWKTITSAGRVTFRVTLQWGHGSEAVEDPRAGSNAGGHGSASMGPRLGSRGRPAVRGRRRRPVRASMGPRLGSRGRRDDRGSREAAVIGFNGATARKPWKTGGWMLTIK